ncbi:MAG: chromosome partitioning protein ParB [Pseudomonadota bacterium]
MGDRKKSRFRISASVSEPVERQRGSGPMSAAVRETAESLADSTEAKVEARKLNAQDAKAFRSAREDGLLIERIPLADVSTSDLPRDRIDLAGVETSDEMDELKASLRSFGQKEPVELYRSADGSLQLKKGWRRLTALRSLFAETGDDRFGLVLARIDVDQSLRIQHYIDMVEENVIREDLTFAEMAQVAISAAADPSVEGDNPEAQVSRLYGSLHKQKRYNIRVFVRLLAALGDDLKFPKALARNVGVDLEKAIAERRSDLRALRSALASAPNAAAQHETIQAFLDGPRMQTASARAARDQGKRKFEFQLAETKVTARKGEIRLRSDVDYAEVPRETLERAIDAFRAVLKG